MATYEFELAQIPQDKRSKELWLQHAAGKILFEDARQYAIDKIDTAIDLKTKEKIIEGINDALYGVMMIIDGVSGQLENSEYAINVEARVNLIRKSDQKLIDTINLNEGDGMCMGYHGWLESDFGQDVVASKRDENA